MPFQKGHKFGGKKNTGPNVHQLKRKMEIKEFLEKFVKRYQKQMLDADLAACKPRERMQFMGNMLPYVTPHLSSTDLTTAGAPINPPNIVFNFSVKEKIKPTDVKIETNDKP